MNLVFINFDKSFFEQVFCCQKVVPDKMAVTGESNISDFYSFSTDTCQNPQPGHSFDRAFASVESKVIGSTHRKDKC